MSVTPLSQLELRKIDYAICVRVSRMWEFRGANEENEIKHLDLVLIDREGTPIYAEAPPDAIPHVKPYLQEGNIVYMTKITIERAKPVYRPVENPYMIKLNRRTLIHKVHDQPSDFPKYTFSLTPFEKLSEYTRKTERFLDVIGKIVGVSNTAMVSTASGELMMRRVIKLQDLKDNTIELSLSGKRAAEFDGEKVIEVGQKHHVIAIFVGTLMKLYREQYQFLSGTSACHWYINENDIPEIKVFQRSLPAQVTAVQNLYLQGGDDNQQNFEQRTLLELKDIDPFYHKGKNYECTVTIIGLTEKQAWCYRACKACNSRIQPTGKTYKCTDKDCPCTQFDWKYKIPFVATDDTYCLEFVFFEKKGEELIGKPAQTLQKQYDMFEIPPEISAWIGHKFTFVVRVLTKKSIGAPDPSFEVIRIKQKFGKQSITSRFKIGTIIPEKRSSLSITDIESLPPLVPIKYKKAEDQIQFPRDLQDMELEPSGIWNNSDISDKRVFEGLTDESLETNKPDENQQRETKRLRLEERDKH